MKTYWDSSALLEAISDPTGALRRRLRKERGITRTHALAEVFSALTGNPVTRVEADEAAIAVENLAADLDFVDVDAEEVIVALKKARKLGVRGGRVHDYVHALAADKSGAAELLTLDANDFVGLTSKATVQAL